MKRAAAEWLGIVSFAVAVPLIVVIGAPLTASAKKPPKSPNAGQFTIAANPNPVTFGRSVALSGRLKGNSNSGQTVAVQQNPYPFKGYTQTATKVTGGNGSYSFTVTPKLNTRYRVTTTTVSPALTTAEVLELVRIRISLRVSDSTPKRGARVTFSGVAAPQHDGKAVRIQRRTSTGSYRTVARTVLTDNGDANSRYSKAIRVSRDGVFRARISSDADHVTGTSGRHRILVHG